MKIYRRGYRPPGAITRASCLRRMNALRPKQPKQAISKGMARRAMPRPQGITAKQAAYEAGVRLGRSGVRIGTKPIELPKGANIDNFISIMRGAGYTVRKEDLRKAQQR